MSSPAVQSVEDVIEEDFEKEKAKQLKPPPLLWHKLEAFLKKELEFLGVTQTMIGLVCFFFGVTHEIILNYLKCEEELLTYNKHYPIWGGLLMMFLFCLSFTKKTMTSGEMIQTLKAPFPQQFTISGSLLIASERKNIKYLVQSRLVMAILSSVTAGCGMKILWDNLNETSLSLPDCKSQPYEDFCFGVSFLTETTFIILFLTILELNIGLFLIISKIIGKIMETWIAKHRKGYHEALYEELPIYYPISEYVELQSRENISLDPKDPRTESRESLPPRLSHSPEELQQT